MFHLTAAGIWLRMRIDHSRRHPREDSLARCLCGRFKSRCAPRADGSVWSEQEPEESALHRVYRSGVYARGLIQYSQAIQYSAAQAHMLIDACEEMLLRSMAVALEMLDQALCCLIVPVVYEDAGHKLQTCADAHRRPRLASYEVSWCSCPSSIPDCNWKGKSDTDVEWWWGGSDTLYQVYC